MVGAHQLRSDPRFTWASKTEPSCLDVHARSPPRARFVRARCPAHPGSACSSWSVPSAAAAAQARAARIIAPPRHRLHPLRDLQRLCPHARLTSLHRYPVASCLAWLACQCAVQCYACIDMHLQRQCVVHYTIPFACMCACGATWVHPYICRLQPTIKLTHTAAVRTTIGAACLSAARHAHLHTGPFIRGAATPRHRRGCVCDTQTRQCRAEPCTRMQVVAAPCCKQTDCIAETHWSSGMPTFRVRYLNPFLDCSICANYCALEQRDELPLSSSLLPVLHCSKKQSEAPRCIDRVAHVACIALSSSCQAAKRPNVGKQRSAHPAPNPQCVVQLPRLHVTATFY